MPRVTWITNANILTMDPGRPSAWGLRIADGKITHLLADSSAPRASADSTVIDARGKTVIPGFNDCHMHILPYGLQLGQADLSPAAGVRSAPELVAALRRWIEANQASEWALGNRYDQNSFPGAAHPTRRYLDVAFPNQPVYVSQTSGHAGAANSVALKLAGITRDTPNPSGGEIVRDSTGEPTGVLLESAEELIRRAIPRPGRAEMAAAIRRANDCMVREGITSASDLHTGWLDLTEEIAAYRMAAEGGASIRMTLFPHAPAFGKPSDLPDRGSFLQEIAGSALGEFSSGRGGIRIGPVKLFSDGALTTRTAALREPFLDGGSGMLLHAPEELTAYITAAHGVGWQVATHAIGDRAIELVLDSYLAAEKASPRSGVRGAYSLTIECRGAYSRSVRGRDFRHRIEHAMLLDEGLIRRIKEQKNVIPVVQPEFVARLGDAYVMGLGEERAARLNPTASLQRAGIPVPFSSDCPVVPGSPLDGIRAAVNRKTPSGRILGPQERISPMDALRNYTHFAAYSTFDEHETGRLIPGMRADLAIIDGGFTEESIESAKVVATMIGGELVYGSDRFNK